eukprot:8591920-Alexandrium_andersonii.AAC.1
MGDANAAPGTPVQGPGPIPPLSFGQSHYAPAHGPVIPPGDMGGLGNFGGGWSLGLPGGGDGNPPPYGFGPFGGGGGLP